jgi:hypothetical protein
VGEAVDESTGKPEFQFEELDMGALTEDTREFFMSRVPATIWSIGALGGSGVSANEAMALLGGATLIGGPRIQQSAVNTGFVFPPSEIKENKTDEKVLMPREMEEAAKIPCTVDIQEFSGPAARLILAKFNNSCEERIICTANGFTKSSQFEDGSSDQIKDIKWKYPEGATPATKTSTQEFVRMMRNLVKEHVSGYFGRYLNGLKQAMFKKLANDAKWKVHQAQDLDMKSLFEAPKSYEAEPDGLEKDRAEKPGWKIMQLKAAMGMIKSQEAWDREYRQHGKTYNRYSWDDWEPYMQTALFWNQRGWTDIDAPPENSTSEFLASALTLIMHDQVYNRGSRSPTGKGSGKNNKRTRSERRKQSQQDKAANRTGKDDKRYKANRSRSRNRDDRRSDREDSRKRPASPRGFKKKPERNPQPGNQIRMEQKVRDALVDANYRKNGPNKGDGEKKCGICRKDNHLDSTCLWGFILKLAGIKSDGKSWSEWTNECVKFVNGKGVDWINKNA